MFLRNKQAGSLLVVVIFVLVVMGFLATNLSKIEWSNRDSQVRDLVGLQASLLANSSNEVALSHIYPPRATLSTAFDVTTRCTELNNTSSAIPSTITCEPVTITCQALGGQLANGQQMYVLESTAQCGTGIDTMRRSQQILLRSD